MAGLFGSSQSSHRRHCEPPCEGPAASPCPISHPKQPQDAALTPSHWGSCDMAGTEPRCWCWAGIPCATSTLPQPSRGRRALGGAGGGAGAWPAAGAGEVTVPHAGACRAPAHSTGAASSRPVMGESSVLRRIQEFLQDCSARAFHHPCRR